MGSKRRHTALFVVAVLLLFVAPASASVRQGPGGLRFYSPPTKLLRGAHGSVVWARTLTGPAVLSAASRNILVVYRSVSPLGKDVFVSGTVAIPRGKAPVGGWPVIAWNHGTTGIADACATSRGFGNFEDRRVVLTRFLRRGFAVVQTDYPGLGTPGVHPLAIGLSEGRGVVDMVRAARVLDNSIGRRWLPIGESQGGHATLWSAAVGPKWAPELRLIGAVSLAPSSHAKLQLELGRMLPVIPPPQLAFAAFAFAGAATLGWDPDSVLTSRGAKLLQLAYSRCSEQLARSDVLKGIAPRDVLRADANYAPISRILDANDPGTLMIKAPVFVGQGTKDVFVLATWTDEVVTQLRSRGARIQYKLYPVAHGAPEVLAAYNDYTRFIAARFRLYG